MKNQGVFKKKFKFLLDLFQKCGIPNKVSNLPEDTRWFKRSLKRLSILMKSFFEGFFQINLNESLFSHDFLILKLYVVYCVELRVTESQLLRALLLAAGVTYRVC